MSGVEDRARRVRVVQVAPTRHACFTPPTQDYEPGTIIQVGCGHLHQMVPGTGGYDLDRWRRLSDREAKRTLRKEQRS